jgi:hypothetical protein
MNDNPTQIQNLKSKIQNPKSKTVWFQPMGFKLRLISNSPAIIEAAETSFGRFGPVRPTPSPDFTFRLFQHELDDGQLKPPVFRMEGSLLYQSGGRDSTLVADLADGLAFGYFSATTLAQPAFFRWHFLELAFFIMLEARGLMGVHGSALVKNGRAILLRARSGGGKTTLAYAGARNRYQALAEDVVWLDRRRNCWWGFPWFFHLLPDAKKLFPELMGYVPALQINGELKLEVNLEDIRPGSTTVSARPGAVVLIERRAGEKSQLEPLDPAQAHALWAEARTGLELKLAHHQPYIEALLRDNVYRLYYGDDIEASLDLLEPLFA